MLTDHQVQSCHWETIAEEHIDHVASICSSFVFDALCHHSAEDVRDNVWAQHLEDTLQNRKHTALTFLKCISRSFQDYPINHNHYYTETVQKIRRQRDLSHGKQAAHEATVHDEILNEKGTGYIKVERISPTKFVQSLTQNTELDMLQFSCEEALDCMRAIYKVNF